MAGIGMELTDAEYTSVMTNLAENLARSEAPTPLN
jgi:hypothetical protein